MPLGEGHPTSGGSLGPLDIHKLCQLSLMVKGSLQTLAEYSFTKSIDVTQQWGDSNIIISFTQIYQTIDNFEEVIMLIKAPLCKVIKRKNKVSLDRDCPMQPTCGQLSSDDLL